MELSHNQPTRLQNARCAYCNTEFSRSDEPQKEHVIGRLFVPKGSHDRQWNLHLNSCHECNQRKSNLENDISAITMISQLPEGAEDEILLSEASRKSRTKSQRTERPVADSAETFQFEHTFGNAKMSFCLSAPPQVDDHRMFALARYQLAGFFFMITYKKDKEMGVLWPGDYLPIGVVRRQNWGDPAKASFSQATKDWPLRFAAGTSSGYYCALIKKHPAHEIWSWALEWNQNFRLFGFFGDKELAKKMVSDFAVSKREGPFPGPDGSTFYATTEIPLDEEQDIFFYVDEKSSVS